MPHPSRVRVTTALVAVLGVAACAPQNTNTVFSGEEIGRMAQIRMGQIVSMRPVAVQSQNSGVGAIGGAAVGGVAGSFIGRNDVGANILGAVGGALIGGLAGNAVEGATGRGQAVEFIIHTDDGQTLSVVQTNELQFQPGERVVLTLGARTRISRAAPGT